MTTDDHPHLAGTSLNFKVIARSAAGVECSLPEGAHFGASLSGRRGAEVPPPTIRHVRAGLFELSLCCEVAGVHELRVQLHQGSVPGEQGGGGGSGGERTDRLCGEGADDDGGVDVCGSPVSIVVTPAAPSPEHCTLTGDCLRLGTAIAGKRQDGPRIYP